jgi:aminomethyltransferase
MARIARGFSSLKRTALFDYHVSVLGGKMVPFAGYEMPVEYKNYSGGVLKEHFLCRESAALFDVGHMGQVKIHGKDRVKFLDHLIVGDLQGLKEGSAMLSLITNERGGIIDDTVVTKFDDHM